MVLLYKTFIHKFNFGVLNFLIDIALNKFDVTTFTDDFCYLLLFLISLCYHHHSIIYNL